MPFNVAVKLGAELDEHAGAHRRAGRSLLGGGHVNRRRLTDRVRAGALRRAGAAPPAYGETWPSTRARRRRSGVGGPIWRDASAVMLARRASSITSRAAASWSRPTPTASTAGSWRRGSPTTSGAPCPTLAARRRAPGSARDRRRLCARGRPPVRRAADERHLARVLRPVAVAAHRAAAARQPRQRSRLSRVRRRRPARPGAARSHGRRRARRRLVGARARRQPRRSADQPSVVRARRRLAGIYGVAAWNGTGAPPACPPSAPACSRARPFSRPGAPTRARS